MTQALTAAIGRIRSRALMADGGTGVAESTQSGWDWQSRPATHDRANAARHLRRLGILQGLLLIMCAALLMVAADRPRLGIVLLALGAAQVLTAVLRPSWLMPMWRFGRWLGAVVSVGLTWALLMPFFALVIVPAGMLARLFRRDLLTRKPLEPGLTGWIPRRIAFDKASLTRQFLAERRQARPCRRPDDAPVASMVDGEPGSGTLARP